MVRCNMQPVKVQVHSEWDLGHVPWCHQCGCHHGYRDQGQVPLVHPHQCLHHHCWEKWHAWRMDIQRTSHVRDETLVKCNKQVTSKQEIRFSLTFIK
jgi:hypothetical protein